MILKNHFKQVLLGGLAFAILIFIGSCDSENENPGPVNQQQIQKQKILKNLPGVIQQLPKFKIVYEADKSNGKGSKDGGFSFSGSGSGFSFANPSGNTYTDEDGYTVITTPGFGSNSGGAVTAGRNSYSINQTFCLSAEDDEGDDDFGDLSFFGDGVSLIIGVSGDFEEASDEESLEGLDALVLYFVFDGRAQGNYDVLDFLEDADDDIEDLEDVAFAYIMDFKNGYFYISSSGSLNVNGGSISFSGEYLEIEMDEGDDIFDVEEIEDFRIVSGGGAMGCE